MSMQSLLALSDPKAYADLLERQAEENAALLAAAAPSTCASCRHIVGHQAGLFITYACVNPDLKVVNMGDATGIERLDFGCIQWEAKSAND